MPENSSPGPGVLHQSLSYPVQCIIIGQQCPQMWSPHPSLTDSGCTIWPESIHEFSVWERGQRTIFQTATRVIFKMPSTTWISFSLRRGIWPLDKKAYILFSKYWMHYIMQAFLLIKLSRSLLPLFVPILYHKKGTHPTA